MQSASSLGRLEPAGNSPPMIARRSSERTTSGRRGRFLTKAMWKLVKLPIQASIEISRLLSAPRRTAFPGIRSALDAARNDTADHVALEEQVGDDDRQDRHDGGRQRHAGVDVLRPA